VLNEVVVSLIREMGSVVTPSLRGKGEGDFFEYIFEVI